MFIPSSLQLPIDSVLPKIREIFRNHSNILIHATPGSGKTTRVPFALLEDNLNLKIAVLEPRRLAAKIAAQRICDEQKLIVGERVGYQVKDENKSSPQSQIIFYTEAILAKKFFSDPILENIDAIIFDEFHERHLYTDFCIALCIRANKFREHLGLRPRPLILMSATSDISKVSKLISPLQIVNVHQKIHPLEIQYSDIGFESKNFIETAKNVLPEIISKLPADGNVLFFLPGKFEIDRMEEFLQRLFIQNDLSFEIFKLFGSMTLDQQSKIFNKFDTSKKFILSTNVAESSVTIPGVRIVIDSGLARISGFNPFTGAKTLSLKKISQASCIQRAGRAAREGSGLCIRLFSEADYLARGKHEVPEIHRSSISQLILENARIESNFRDKFSSMLSKTWESTKLNFLELPWLDIPNQSIYEHSKLELQYLENIDKNGTITKLGYSVATKSLNPRLATLCELAKNSEHQEIASWLSCVLEWGELNFSDFPINIETTFKQFRARMQSRSLDSFMAKFKNSWNEIHRKCYGSNWNLNQFSQSDLDKFSYLLWQAFPDKIAKKTKTNNKDRFQEIEYQICTGGSCLLRDTNLHSAPEWIVVLDGLKLDSKFNNDQRWVIRFYQEIHKDQVELLETSNSGLVSFKNKMDWNESKIKVVQISQSMYGCLNLNRETRDLEQPTKESQEFFFKFLSSQQSSFNKVFDGGEDLWKNFIHRLKIASSLNLVNTKSLVKDCEFQDQPKEIDVCVYREVFLKFVSSKVTRVKDFEEFGFEFFTREFLGEETYQKLEANLPRFWKPSAHYRKSFEISYNEDATVTVAAKIQDFFGLKDSPSLAQGQIKLRLEFLGPHGRPLQISSDLKSFWSNSYPQLRKELMRRYPKHHWPEDPTAPKIN